MYLAITICVVLLMLLAFSMAEGFLIGALGLATEYSRVLHAFVASFFALENWALQHELEEAQRRQQQKLPDHEKAVAEAQSELIERLVTQNSRLEQLNMRIKRSRKGIMIRKSYSFDVATMPSASLDETASCSKNGKKRLLSEAF